VSEQRDLNESEIQLESIHGQIYASAAL
jgi:hypothetical protein